MGDRVNIPLICVGPRPAFLQPDRTEQCDDLQALERMLQTRQGKVSVLLAVPVDPRILAGVARRHPLCRWWSEHSQPCADHYLRTALLRGLSHSLRSPLALVQGALDELEERLGDDSREWELIRRGAARLRRTAGLLSDVAEIESRERPVALEPRETTLQAVTESAWQDARSLTPLGQEVTLHSRMDAARRPVTLRAALLQRALREIFVNARQYADTLVEVRATSTEAGWAVEVIDDGPGPGVARDPTTWERFVPAALRGTRSDLGLGLSIALDEVNALGGQIQIDHANSTTGTTVRISGATASR